MKRLVKMSDLREIAFSYLDVRFKNVHVAKVNGVDNLVISGKIPDIKGVNVQVEHHGEMTEDEVIVLQLKLLDTEAILDKFKKVPNVYYARLLISLMASNPNLQLDDFAMKVRLPVGRIVRILLLHKLHEDVDYYNMPLVNAYALSKLPTLVPELIKLAKTMPPVEFNPMVMVIWQEQKRAKKERTTWVYHPRTVTPKSDITPEQQAEVNALIEQSYKALQRVAEIYKSVK